LRREALASAALDHPYICKIHEIGDADGRTFIVMEYIEGETLQVAQDHAAVFAYILRVNGYPTAG
jgi:serine/threonine protein kinase